MTKPNGLSIKLGPGGPSFELSPIDRTADAVWDSVEAAILDNWTPERFLGEVREAWEYHRDQLKKAELEALHD